MLLRPRPDFSARATFDSPRSLRATAKRPGLNIASPDRLLATANRNVDLFGLGLLGGRRRRLHGDQLEDVPLCPLLDATVLAERRWHRQLGMQLVADAVPQQHIRLHEARL